MIQHFTLSLSLFLSLSLPTTMKIKNFCKMILFPLFSLCLCINTLTFSHASISSTISVNRTLSGDQTIVSSGGKFELGFFTPGNSSKYYVGIWYRKVTPKIVFWVANRETPIKNNQYAQVKILDGNLVLLDESHIKIWSTDLNSTTPTTSNSVVALLLDNGNLVLREGSSLNSIDFIKNLWESFDNPTDTWMPGGKLGYDKRRQKKIALTSWKNLEDPSPGLYSLEIDPNERQYVIMWNGSVKYWNSESWGGHIFSQMNETRLNYIYNYSYVDTENETYFTYSPNDPSLLSRYIMDISGQIKQLNLVNYTKWSLFWSQPRSQCDVYGGCGVFSICDENQWPPCSCLLGFKRSTNDYFEGCVREIGLSCVNSSFGSSNRRKDRFLMVPNLSLPYEYSQSSWANISIGECESACLSNCSCTAYAIDEKKCFVWKGELLNLQQLAQGDGREKAINIRLSVSSSVFHGSKNAHKDVVVGGIVGSVVLVSFLLAIILFIVCIHQRHRVKASMVEGFLVGFGYKDLQNATKNFSDKLGGGGFGSVFKGTLPDSTVVAVKKLEGVSQGEKQFRAEVSTIGIIHHANLVRLRGFCTQGDKKLLVYDYMENGSLDAHLFKESKILKWKTRYQIALCVARGLAYLHENCRDCIIHCDIKPENILLDAEFCPKVADFGLAKLVGHDFSRVLTTMRGTLGYLAPEWISGVAITCKADVYSYGMMLFELISGKRNWKHLVGESVKYFPCLAATVIIEGGDVIGLLDPILEGDANLEEVTKMCRVACWCVQYDENIRPSMSQVVQIFEGVMDVNLPPMPRWLEVLVDESPQTSSLN